MRLLFYHVFICLPDASSLEIFHAGDLKLPASDWHPRNCPDTSQRDPTNIPNSPGGQSPTGNVEKSFEDLPEFQVQRRSLNSQTVCSIVSRFQVQDGIPCVKLQKNPKRLVSCSPRGRSSAPSCDRSAANGVEICNKGQRPVRGAPVEWRQLLQLICHYGNMKETSQFVKLLNFRDHAQHPISGRQCANIIPYAIFNKNI